MMCKVPETGWGLACWRPSKIIRGPEAMERNLDKLCDSWRALIGGMIAYLTRSKGLRISWPQSPSLVILEPKKRKSVTASTFSPSVCQEVMGPDAMIIFWILSFKPTFSFSFTLIKKKLVSSFSLSAIRVVLSAYRKLYYFCLQSWFQLVIHPARHFVWCALHRS